MNVILDREKVAVDEIPVGEFILFDKIKIYYSERDFETHYFKIFSGFGISKSVLEKFFRVSLIVLMIGKIDGSYYLLITPESFIQNSFKWTNKNNDMQLICPEDKFIKIESNEEVREIFAKFFRNSD